MMTGNSTFEYYNANRDGKNVGDCTVRAISVALDQDWDTTYWGLCWEGYLAADMPSGNPVWGKYLRRKGWRRYLPEYEDMTVQEFAHEHPYGVYLLALDTHIVCVFDGRIVDTWNSGGKTVLYYCIISRLWRTSLHSFVGHSISPFPSKFRKYSPSRRRLVGKALYG